MKKVIFAGVVLAAIGITILMACSKEVQSQTAAKQTTDFPVLKSSTTRRILSEADLIAAIKGEKSEFVNLADLEDLLYENARLSNTVIHALVEEERVPDFIVETALILSAPVASAELTYLKVRRSSLSTTAIVAAADSKSDANYVIVNSNPRQVLFGYDMIKTMTCSGCGEGTIKANRSLLIEQTSETGDLEPAEIKPCNSSNTDWVCGTAKRVRLASTDGTTATYTVTCEQSSKKCIQNVQNARN